jgi:hypothetical protein
MANAESGIPNSAFGTFYAEQKSSYRVLDSLRIFTKRNPVIFVHK